jgi:pimeloyl-ACP methyl ester carboxylesterase
MPPPLLSLRRCAAALCAAGLAGLAQAATPPSALQPCRLDGLEHEAWCGVLKRPLDPAHPQGVQIDLHYAVIPALARNKQPDPVFFFAGGPGQSAIDLAALIAARFERLGNRRDLVLIDQRGTGRSAPLNCGDGSSASLAAAFDPAQELQALRACRERLQRLPYGDLRFFTTPIASQDADAVRQALGAARIDAIGASYGTRAVLDYMRQFPQHVRRAVIDGVAPPDMVLPASFSPDNQAALDAVFAQCAQDARCNAQYPRLHARFEALLASLPRSASVADPLTGRAQTVTVTRDGLLAMLRLPLYAPPLASALPMALSDAADGRFEPLLALASGLGGGSKTPAIYEGLHFSVVCAEDMPRLDQATDAPGADFGTGFAAQYRQVCAEWPHGGVSPDFYRVPPAPAPTLLLSGTADPATPPRHAAATARALGTLAREVVVPNAGHGVMSLGCMSDVVYRFVNAASDAEALDVDAACVQHVPRPPVFIPVQPASAAASAPVVRPLSRSGVQRPAPQGSAR